VAVDYGAEGPLRARWDFVKTFLYDAMPMPNSAVTHGCKNMDDVTIGIGLMIVATAIVALIIGGILIAIHNASQRVRRGWQVVKAETKTAFQLERELH
jgi:hypothetical protein